MRRSRREREKEKVEKDVKIHEDVIFFGGMNHSKEKRYFASSRSTPLTRLCIFVEAVAAVEVRELSS